MRRTSIPPYTIYTLASEFVESRGTVPQKRGRPLKYPDALILTIIGIQNLYGFSFREVLEFTRWFFKEVPCLSDFHYRITHIDVSLLEAFLVFLAKKLTDEGLSLNAYAMDGTCWSYQDVYPVNMLRGAQVRMIQSHVRTIVLAGLSQKKRFVLAAVPGEAYASEVKLGTELLHRTTTPRASPLPPPFLADKAYDSIAFLQTLTTKGYLPVVKMKDECMIKHPLRRASAKLAQNQELYGQRTQIEGLFGNTKEKLGSHIRIFRTDVAQRFALMRLALFNISLLCELRGVHLVIFRTVSVWVDKGV